MTKPQFPHDKKLRGEWAESVFMSRAAAHNLPVSKPWGEMSSYDFVIGKTSRFVSVQVKSTIRRMGTGYECTVRGGHKAYATGAFDFLAAYVILEDSWYIIPAVVIRGKKQITLNPNLPTARYEQYREAWRLLREASESRESAQPHPPADPPEQAPATQPARSFPSTALERMRQIEKHVRRFMTGSETRPAESGDNEEIP